MAFVYGAWLGELEGGCMCQVKKSTVQRENKKIFDIIIVSFSLWDKYRIAGNFRGRKLSRISRFESHPRNLGVCHNHL